MRASKPYLCGKRETGEVGVRADNHERRARKRTGWKAHIESKTQGAPLPSSWRSTSMKMHSLPRTPHSTSLLIYSTIFMWTKHNNERRRPHFGFQSFASDSGILSAPDVLFFGMMSGNLQEKLLAIILTIKKY